MANQQIVRYRSKGQIGYFVTVVDFGTKVVKYHMGEDPETVYEKPVAEFLKLYR